MRGRLTARLFGLSASRWVVGYEQSQATLVGCWAHARRKFKEAKTAQGKKPSGKADWALNHIQKLYRIETLIKDKPVTER